MTHTYDSFLALSYMEANPGDFPMSNVNSALQKISQSITPEALEKVSLILDPLYSKISFDIKNFGRLRIVSVKTLTKNFT